ANLCDHLLVMNRKAVGFLRDSYGVAEDKISFIPHGTPTPERVKRSEIRRRLGWHNRKALLTFGLLGRGKGIESARDALAEAVAAVPDLLYVIAGQTHPEVLRHEGEAYREELTARIHNLGLDAHVHMINRYVPEEELVALLTASDLYITPYAG